MPEFKDLGLSYEDAAHGVQTAIAYDMTLPGHKATTPKHLRTGVDMSKSDMFGLTMLLIKKGIITGEEYVEHMRLAANTELAQREEELNRRGGVKLTFR